MPRGTRRAVITSAAVVLNSPILSGCLGGESSEPTEVETIQKRANTALRSDEAWMRESRPGEASQFPLVEVNQTDSGYAVRVDYFLHYSDDQTVETIENHANTTALVVLQALYGGDIVITDVFVQAHIQVDPTPSDVQFGRVRRVAHLVEVTQSTAAATDLSTVSPEQLPEVADQYEFKDNYFG